MDRFMIVNCEFVIWLASMGVPVGDVCRFNFVPVTGRGRGCGHRVCLAGAGL